MNTNHPSVAIDVLAIRKKTFKENIQRVIASENLADNCKLIESIANELNLTMQDCAAALLYLNNEVSSQKLILQENSNAAEKPSLTPIQHSIRFVRYRLDLGHQHQITIEDLKKVLVEESGVDIKNIGNVRIQDAYTLIDLPDEMPQEIFHHLKTVEINQRMLNIRRVKPRNKKRGNRRHRHAKQANSQTNQELSNKAIIV